MVGRSGACGLRTIVGHRQPPDRAGLHQRQRHRGILERELRFARDHRRHRLAAAFVGHVHDVEGKPLLEHLADQVRGRSDAGR